jgi:hypothetical protein
LKFLPPSAALRSAIATGRRLHSIPQFMTNERWLRPPGLPAGPREPAPPEPRRVEVWRQSDAHSLMTSTAAVCAMRGDPDAPSGLCTAARQAAYRRRKQAANGNGGESA